MRSLAIVYDYRLCIARVYSSTTRLLELLLVVVVVGVAQSKTKKRRIKFQNSLNSLTLDAHTHTHIFFCSFVEHLKKNKEKTKEK